MITPSTWVILLENVPFDIGRQHTYRFSDATAQENWFLSTGGYTKHTYNNNVRVNYQDSTVRLNTPYKTAVKCNYLMFQNENTGYENKIFYAFIDSIEYINENVTEITFSIDYIQSYMFDFKVLPCLVEREHTSTDNIGDHVLPEGLDIGEPVLNSNLHSGSTSYNPLGYIQLHCNDSFGYVIIATSQIWEYYDTQGQTGIKTRLGRISIVNHQPINYELIYCQTLTSLNELLNDIEYQGAIANVVCVYIVPNVCIDFANCCKWVRVYGSGSSYNNGDIGLLEDNNGYTVCRTISSTISVSYTQGDGTSRGTGETYNLRSALSIPKPSRTTCSFGSYVPYNNKLYTAPFLALEVSDNNSHVALLHSEYFSSSTIEFSFNSTISSNSQMMCTPDFYKGVSKNYEESIVASGIYEMFPFTVDMFQQYLIQNGSKLALAFAGGVADIVGAFLGGTVGTTISAATSGINTALSGPQYKQNRNSLGQFQSGKYISGWDTSKVTGHQGQTSTTTKTTGTAQAMGALGGAMKCASVLGNIADASYLPMQLQGQVNNGSLNLGSADKKLADIMVRVIVVREDYAKRIDEYFSRFGYRVNSFKIPNFFSTTGVKRPLWNYVKTTDAKIEPVSTTSFNHDVEEAIENILNNGITFWETSETIGEYTQTASHNNMPTS